MSSCNVTTVVMSKVIAFTFHEFLVFGGFFLLSFILRLIFFLMHPCKQIHLKKFLISQLHTLRCLASDVGCLHELELQGFIAGKRACMYACVYV